MKNDKYGRAKTNSWPKELRICGTALQTNQLAEATATYHPAKWHSITPFMSVSRKKLCGTALLESVRRRLQTRRARIKLREIFLKLHADYLLKLLSQGRYDFRFTRELGRERKRESEGRGKREREYEFP